MRRSRYVVTLDNGRQPHVLLYKHTLAGETPQWLIGHYARRGRSIVSIQPYQRQPVQTPPPLKWNVLEANLEQAKAFLGIKLPVYIKRSGGVRTHGTHCLRCGYAAPAVANITTPMYHHITVSQFYGAESAGRTLWHELCHAMQAERATEPHTDRVAAMKAWNDAPERKGTYRNRPIEVEARSYEHFNDELPLIGD